MNSSTPGLVAQRPRIVDAGVGLVFAAAAVNLVIAALVVGQVSVSKAAVQPGLVAAVVAITVLYAAGLVVLALFLRAGRSWARAALISLSSLSLLTILALNALNLAVILLLIAADIVLYRRPVNDWVRSLRGLHRG